MRRPSSFLARRETMDVTMAPMIDVVFLLLIFFIWTSSFHAVEHILPSEMAAQLGHEPDEPPEILPEHDFQDIVIGIGWDGQQPVWSLNDAPMADAAEVGRHLAVIAEIRPENRVIVHPRAAVPVEFVIQAYDEALLAGFPQVSFAVSPAQANSDTN